MVRISSRLTAGKPTGEVAYLPTAGAGAWLLKSEHYTAIPPVGERMDPAFEHFLTAMDPELVPCWRIQRWQRPPSLEHQGRYVTVVHPALARYFHAWTGLSSGPQAWFFCEMARDDPRPRPNVLLYVWEWWDVGLPPGCRSRHRLSETGGPKPRIEWSWAACEFVRRDAAGFRSAPVLTKQWKKARAEYEERMRRGAAAENYNARKHWEDVGRFMGRQLEKMGDVAREVREYRAHAAERRAQMQAAREAR